MIKKGEMKHKEENGDSVRRLLKWMEGRIMFLAVVFFVLGIWHPWVNICFTVTILSSYMVSLRSLRMRCILKSMAGLLGVGAYVLAVIYALSRLLFPMAPWLTALGAFVPIAFVLFGMKRRDSPVRGIMAWLAALNACTGLVSLFLRASWLSLLRGCLMLSLLASYVWITSVSHVYAKLQHALSKRSRSRSLKGDKERLLLNLGVIKIVNHTDRFVEDSIETEKVSDVEEDEERKRCLNYED